MRLRDMLSFLAFGAIVVFVLGYFAAQGLRVRPPDDRTNLAMDVPDINGIVEGSNVLLRGVPIGKVLGTSTSGQAATIEFYVTNPIPVDTEIRLENLSALGESYIELMPRNVDGPVFKNGQRISTDLVKQPPSISELATSVVRVLDQLEPGSLGRIVNEADAALPDPETTLPNISRASLLLNNTVNDMNGQGRTLLNNFQALLSNADWVGPTLTSLAPTIHETGRAGQDFLKHGPIIVRRGEPANINNFNHLIARIQGLLDDRGGDLKVLGDAFQPKLNTLAGALMNLDTSQILDHFLETVPPDGTITLRVTP